MKIGIVTFHCAHNYGAVLQAYALQEALRNLGHDVKIIDYRPRYLTKNYSVFSVSRFLYKNPIRIFKIVCFDAFTLKKRKRRFKMFNDFINGYLLLSSRVKSATQITDNFDAYFMGSDQIWNTKITQGFDSIYFGDFTTSANTKKISYAASIGDCKLSSSEKQVFQNRLTNFDAISVRESSMKDILQPLTHLKINEVLDPTLLIDKESWCKISSPPPIKEKYVLVYQVAKNEETITIAEKVAQTINAKVIQVTSRIQPGQRDQSVFETESPEQFIGWVKNAAYVVTTSFHGTAFSLLLNKQFCSVGKKDSDNSRLISLLKKIDLDGRFLTTSSELSEKQLAPILWERPNRLLYECRKESIQFIKLSLVE